jgi:EAL domain-containing protein (putative c-di-GMP-specific phosphodiesterase class I)
MPGGRLYGALCAVSHAAIPQLGAVVEEVLNVLSAAVTDQLVLLERQEAERATRLAEMQTLLAPGGFSMVTQPIVELCTGCVQGVEALARFVEHPEGPAGVFSSAEHLGLRVDFELAAISAALELLPDLPAPLYMSLNASPATALDPRFGPLLAAVTGHRIVLELTEHIEVADYDDLIDVLESLRATGVRLAIDDAGSGFARLAHILAPDIVKLDIALTHGVDSDPARRALVFGLWGSPPTWGRS